MYNRKLILTPLIVLILFSGCDGSAVPSSTTILPSQDISSRTLLTYPELINGFEPEGIISEDALYMPDNASSSPQLFEGRLELINEDRTGEAEVLVGSLTPERQHLPEFDFSFIQVDNYLVPVQRGLIITAQDTYDFILEPGRIWQEPGDQGWSRASLPFSLVFKASNSLLSGTLTFLFNGVSVSKVWYQTTQEITTTTKANLWGLVDAEYHPGGIPEADQIRDAFKLELASRFPTLPIAQLADDYPGIDLTAFGSGVTPEHMGWYGVVVDGVNYLGGCQTRAGTYAYCEWMRQPSFSIAKSTFPSLAFMHLAQVYGKDVQDLLIKDYVPEAANSIGDWETVTFNNTLDMATGNYGSANFMADDNSEQMSEFFSGLTFADRISSAFAWENKIPAGTQWVYRTSDTFIVTRALQNYLRSQTSGMDDIFEYLVDEIYQPIGMGPGFFSTKRTSDDNWQGQAEGGYGLWFIPDDIAKISAFLLIHNGRIGDAQVLQPDLLAATMQQDPSDRGMQVGLVSRYNNAFWAQKFGAAQGFDCDFWVVDWQGVSGNVVVLMPNGVVYYYFSDNQEFVFNPAVRAADQIRPFCP